MKKALIILILVLTVAFLSTSALADHSRRHGFGSSRPSNFVNVYKFDGSFAGGLKSRLWGGIYATANVQYREEENGVEFQAGAVYMLPIKVLFFRLYGGAGQQFSRVRDFTYPYVVLGADYLFFFSEVLYPISSERPEKYRFGLSFRF
jgi:hypothetical protein